MKTMWVWGVNGLNVTGSAYVPEGVLKKLSLIRSDVASGRPVTGSVGRAAKGRGSAGARHRAAGTGEDDALSPYFLM